MDFKKNKTTFGIDVNHSDVDRLKPVIQFFSQHAFEKLMSSAQELFYGEQNTYVYLFIDELYSNL